MTLQKILIIDDDEMVLVLMQTILSHAGFSVTLTADGPRGIELYSQADVDLVILDLGLPTLNGLDVLERIRKIDPQAKVIVVSGYVSPRFVNDALKLGALRVLEKPVPAEVLIQEVSNALVLPHGST